MNERQKQATKDKIVSMIEDLVDRLEEIIRHGQPEMEETSATKFTVLRLGGVEMEIVTKVTARRVGQ